MKICVKVWLISNSSAFRGFDYILSHTLTFIHSNAVINDVTKYVTHRIFNTN